MLKMQTGRGLLGQYFPSIRTREEIVNEIYSNRRLLRVYEGWNEQQRERFLDSCTGVRGVKVLYDAFFKEIMNPEYTPKRLEDFLSLVLSRRVKLVQILPPDSARIANESALLIMDIVVELDDGSIANVEVQKIGYRFPGERCACYSADLLLRQYKRVREDWKREEGHRKRHLKQEDADEDSALRTDPKFSYKNIKNVYTVILFEKSPEAFHEFEDTCFHHFEQSSNTGLKINLLQEYDFIALDIFRKNIYNRGIQDELDAWLVFLSMDDPEMIVGLLEKYPKFRVMYEQIYDICLNTEEVMGMFSRELKELDDNTVEYMIDELQGIADDAIERLRQAKEETIRAIVQADQAKEEANQAQKRADQAKEEADQAKEEADQAKEEADQAKEEADQAKEEASQAQKQADQAKEEANQAQKQADQAKEEADQAKEEASQAQKQADQAKAQAHQEKERADKAEEEKRQLERKYQELLARLEESEKM